MRARQCYFLLKLPVLLVYYHMGVSKYLCGAAVFQMGAFFPTLHIDECVWSIGGTTIDRGR